MAHFKKPTLKLISLSISIVFCLNTSVYGIDIHARSHLRPRLIFDGDEREVDFQKLSEVGLKTKPDFGITDSLTEDISVGISLDEISASRMTQILDMYRDVLYPDFEIRVFFEKIPDELGGFERGFSEFYEGPVEIFDFPELFNLRLEIGDEAGVTISPSTGLSPDILQYIMDNIRTALQDESFLFSEEEGSFLSSVKGLEEMFKQFLKVQEETLVKAESDMQEFLERARQDAPLLVERLKKASERAPIWRDMAEVAWMDDRRFSLPYIFRIGIPDSFESDDFEVALGPDGCLILTFSRLLEQAQKRIEKDALFLSSMAKLDKQRRINIKTPDKIPIFRRYAKITPESRLIFIGQGPYIEIWEKDLYQKKFGSRFVDRIIDKLPEALETRKEALPPQEAPAIEDGPDLPQLGFLGKYMRRIDGNYRVSFSEIAGEHKIKNLVVTLGRDGNLILTSPDLSPEISKRLRMPEIIYNLQADFGIDITEEEAQRFLDITTYSPYIDNHGRMCFSEKARDFLEKYLGVTLGGNIVFVGRGNYFELWPEDRYNKRFAKKDRLQLPPGMTETDIDNLDNSKANRVREAINRYVNDLKDKSESLEKSVIELKSLHQPLSEAVQSEKASQAATKSTL